MGHFIGARSSSHQPSQQWQTIWSSIIIIIIIIIIITIIIIIIIIIITIIIIIIIIIELTHNKTILEDTAEIEPQPVALDFESISQYFLAVPSKNVF